MMEVDLNQIVNTLIAGGAIYAGIRIEIRFLWRDVGRLRDRIKGLERRHEQRRHT